MAGIHNRMPVILGPQEAAAWLDTEQRPDDLLQLLKPYSGEMVAFPVAPLVNKVGNDGPERSYRLAAIPCCGNCCLAQ